MAKGREISMNLPKADDLFRMCCKRGGRYDKIGK